MAQAATDAPDLDSVDNFRAGDGLNGGPSTLIDFTFDQNVYVNGGDGSSFNLVPNNGGDPVLGIGTLPDAETAGDPVVTVEFTGTVAEADFARGWVKSEVVTSRNQGANSANPSNINQAADIGDGITDNPDLQSATIDGDTVTFTFDEALTPDDVVQNNGGLRIYFPTTTGSTLSSAGALSVNTVEGDPNSLRATYGNDLPQGNTLDDAAGAYVTQGSVQAADDDGANEGDSAFDEIAPLQNNGTDVCAAPAPIDSSLVDSGPTEAPDVLSVGNFRRGPSTAQLEPTTCVDFTFDQAAYLNNGDQSSFSLVPLDAGDALSGSTNQTVPSGTETEGDEIVTVIYPGDLDPANFARGFVDTGVVSSEDGNANEENPYNVNQSADIEPGVSTDNPDLVQVSSQGDAMLFEFDQALTADDVAQNSSGLRLYFPETDSTSTIPFAGSSRVESVDPMTLRAFYVDLPEGYTINEAVGAYVVQGSVQAAPGEGGGNDGNNVFHEIQLNGSSPDGELCNGQAATVDGLTGTPGDDVIVGTDAAETINGLGGDDVICGGGGDDTLLGGEGDDELLGAAGNDTFDGGLGDDLLLGGVGDDTLLQPGASPDGNDKLFGGPGDDTVDYSNRDEDVDATIGEDGGGEEGENDTIGDDIENITGGSGDDTLTGNEGDNSLDGGGGDDSLNGEGGNDSLTGGSGVDDFDGGAGNDSLEAADQTADGSITCGSGGDTATVDDLDTAGADCETVFTGGAPASGPLHYEPLPVLDRPFDSRSTEASPLSAGETRVIDIDAPSGATAALVNITMVRPRSTGAYVTVWEPDTDRPETSSVNADVGDVAANASIVPVDENGEISVFAFAATDLIIDVAGFYVDAPTAVTSGRVLTTDPERVVDSRQSPSAADNDYTRVDDGAGERLTIDVIDDSDLPDGVDLPGGADDVEAVALVITGVQSQGPGPGFVTAYPSGAERPTASNVNVNPGTDVRANLVVVPVSEDGSVEIYLERVRDVVVDIAGYVTAESAPESTDGRFRMIAPTREVDTRSSQGFETFEAGDTRSIDYLSLPAEAHGVAHNLTMAQTGARGYVSAGPVVNESPQFSSVNAAGPDLIRAALNIVDLSDDGSVEFYSFEATDLAVDVFGWYE